MSQLGQKLTWACSDGSSVFSPTTDIETASDGRAETDDERQVAAVVNAAAACRRWLDAATPNLDEARCAVDWIVNEGNRASEVIRRVRALANKTDIEKVPLDINDVVKEAFALVQREMDSHRVSLRMEL